MRAWTPIQLMMAFWSLSVRGLDYCEIAEILQLTEANTRQLVTRARKHIADGRQGSVCNAERTRFLNAFIAAARAGDLLGLEALFAKLGAVSRLHSSVPHVRDRNGSSMLTAIREVVMDSFEPEVALKDAALRAIGRNLVAFQRLEMLLKGLAGLRAVACKLPELTTELERRRKRTESSTLGSVISLWLETARGSEPEAPTLTTDLDVWVSFSFQPGIPQHVLDEHAKQLDQILAERNGFVHSGLTDIDFDSNEACENLIARLDEQERRVIEQIEFLRPLVNRIREFNEFVARDDVQQTIQREMLRGGKSE